MLFSNTHYSWLILLALVITLSVGCEAGWIYDLNKKSCARVYSGNDYSGFNLSISNGNAFADLSSFSLKPTTQELGESRKMSDTWNNQIKSIHIEPDCRARVCVDTHLEPEGKCKWIKTSLAALDATWSKQISSVGCGCPVPNCESQTCPNIKLRGKECGRAFFEPNCNTCDGRFLTIRQHEKAEVGRYAENISSILVKSGCTLLTYTEEDFEGEFTKLESEFRNDWDKTTRIRSYNCYCTNSSKDGTRKPGTQNPDDPILIDIPLTSQENMNLAVKYPDHPGLTAALTSMRNNRSPRNAYILVIGLTGSGKSASINFLFDTKVCEVGWSTSVTSAIHEYRIPVQVDELGCKNCELRVIDTPGYGDTEGLGSDANFLAGLEHYLKYHEELKDRLPNIVLVFSKFSDNRLKGKSSAFVKALRGIDFFRDRLLDLKYSNAVTVLTHFMSENSKVRKNPAEKLSRFRETIEEYTLFPKPLRIAVAENKPDELPMINGYYYLPNKEYYPQNVFEQIQEATGAHDPVGEAIIRNAFKRPEDFNITELPFLLKGVKFVREQHYLSELNKGNFDIDNTEISNITETVFTEQISSDLKRLYPGALRYTQRVLNLQSIFTKQDVPRTTIDIVKLFKNIRHNPLIQELLDKAFELKIPELGINIVAGQSYNILKDSVLPTTPFLKMDTDTSLIGYKIPNTVTCKLMSEMVDIFHWYDTHEEYLRGRIASLKVDEGIIREDLSGDIRPGFNTLEEFNSNGTKMKIVSVLREYRLFQLTLNEKLKFDPIFQATLKAIPVFDEANHISVDKWKQFFNKYGTHVVRSVYGGGAIEGRFKIRNPNTPTEQALGEYKKSIHEFFRFLHDIYLKKNIRSNDINITNITYSLKFFGGDFKHDVSDFSRLSIDETSKRLDGFEESLAFQPTILTSSMELIPLSEVVKKVDAVGSGKIIEAAKALFNATLTYAPPPPQPPPLERPEVKKYIQDLSEVFALQIDRLTHDFNKSSETFNNFTTKLIEENKKEREILLQKIAAERKETLKVIALSCHYEEPDLKGTQLCTANMETCVNVALSKVKSVNTHNSCVRFYLGRGCSGTYFDHQSNAKSNTKFPINVPDGQWFSVIRCDSAR